MNKSQLIEAVAEKAGIKKKDAEAAVTAVFDTITGALKKKDAVQVSGFGSFKVRHRAARTGRNPQTGAQIKIAAYDCAGFVPSKALKRTLNK